jgi:methylmalonyl-CoA mutase C-terminal domain/subunit
MLDVHPIPHHVDRTLPDDLVGDVHAVGRLRIPGLGDRWSHATTGRVRTPPSGGITDERSGMITCRILRRRPHARQAELPRRSIRLDRMAQKLRVIVAKPGLDGHDRGAKVVARALRDAGFEVIYTGLFQTPEQIAEAAIQEDADAVGLSCHSGAHMTLFPKVVKELRARGADDVVVVAGGVIPADDIPKLKEAGIEEVFTPGANTADIASWLRDRLSAKA